MKHEQPEISGARRGFFRAVAGVGVVAGTGALILRGEPEQPAATPADKQPPESSQYRETDHIRKYYETARG